MKLKRIAAATALAISAAPILAQNFEGTTYEERIAATNNGNEDSIKIGINNISLWQQYYKTDPQEALINLRWLVKNAPYALTGIYTQGPKVYLALLQSETDEAKKKEYFKELTELFELREKNLEVLNTFAKNKSTLGDVLAVKADFLNWAAQVFPGSGYTLNKSYENYCKAIKMINEKGGREIEGNMLLNFFLTSTAMYKNSPNTMREQYLQDYLDCKDACEKMLQLAKEAKTEGDEEKANKLFAIYDQPSANIDQLFSESGAADREQVIAIYTKKFESYKSDIDKLNSAINLMANNDCDDAEIYYQYAEAAYAIQPTYNSAIGLAQKAQKDGEMDKMLDYYNKALELAADDAKRGRICLNISNALTKSKQFTGALKYSERAIEYNPDLTGMAYLRMAKIYAQLGQYPKAIEYCTKAADADITVSGDAMRWKSRIQTAQADQAANDRARKAYDDFVRKQQAEEAFWNKGHKK
ncbi:MAG: tetratricopeptide repeat protein [Bacteroidaceae bacterium]|nr:tetratricopeptide repeat protein [Bacteroidaceae bacterium]